MTHLSETEKLIDVLIEHWRFWELHEDFYLTNLAPSLVSDPSKGDDLERETLAKLRQVLTQDVSGKPSPLCLQRDVRAFFARLKANVCGVKY